MNTARWLGLAAAALGACSGNPPAQPDSGTPPVDHYAALRDVPANGVRCEGDFCCYRSCGLDQSLRCVTRDVAELRDLLAGEQGAAGCTGVVFPEWFYANDCYVVVEADRVQQAAPRHLEPITAAGHEGELAYGPIVACLCGRSASSYSSAYSTYVYFVWNACSAPMAELSPPAAALLACTASQCQTCSPRCGGRACGPNGCGGQCGTCGGGTSCSAGGQCSSGGNGCSGCLSGCRGLSSCCTGCGCICESACAGENPFGC